MQKGKDQDRLDDLRKRLYDRSGTGRSHERAELTDEKKDVPTKWHESSHVTSNGDVAFNKTTAETPAESPSPVPEPAFETVTEPSLSDTMPRKNKRRAFRFKLLLAGIFFFIVAVGLSSLFIFFGGNAISGENISVNVTGPFTIGGGEILRLQVGVTNQNSVPIESATLIMEYPAGTQAADQSDRELFVERLSLETIESGETVNIPIQAKVFGEENDELIIRASVEYRVRGSNATFFREAEPLTIKISSSPVVLDIDAVENLASGQETDITVRVVSNAPTEISDILVKAEYPSGFDFTSASPNPVAGQNVWLIDSLAPEETAEITIRGAIVGSETESYAMNFSVGVPNERDRYSLASVFSTGIAEFSIEEPFLDVAVTVNDVTNSTAAVSPNETSNVAVVITNTLQNTIYDGVVELKLSGNALSDDEVKVTNGYYDSNTKTITWDISSASTLERLIPGDTERFGFTIRPQAGVSRTPQINLDAVVRARRVSERNAQEEIVGTIQSVIKVTSGVGLLAETGYNITVLNDTGPIPPEVGETTTYTITQVVENGSNSISDVVVTANVPSYVSWVGQTAGNGTYEYNPTTRVLTWNVASLNAGAIAQGSFQVSILPSISQVDKTPTLVSDLQLKANDDFTGAVIRAETNAVTTKMPEENGYDQDNGTVVGG
ncbi:MAG: hypothetical protein R3B69_03155 [Candidatus Paceibacterota bacterium]